MERFYASFLGHFAVLLMIVTAWYVFGLVVRLLS